MVALHHLEAYPRCGDRRGAGHFARFSKRDRSFTNSRSPARFLHWVGVELSSDPSLVALRVWLRSVSSTSAVSWALSLSRSVLPCLLRLTSDADFQLSIGDKLRRNTHPLDYKTPLYLQFIAVGLAAAVTFILDESPCKHNLRSPLLRLSSLLSR